MRPSVIFALGILLGAAAGAVISGTINRRIIKTLRARVRALRNETEEPRRMETMKVIVYACVLNGFAWIWCSYVLAALDKTQIAESLSTAAVTEIIGAVLAYALKSLVENLSKNNHWPDKAQKPGQTTEEPEDGQDGNPPAAG